MTNQHQTQLVLIINPDGQANYLLDRILKSMGFVVELSSSLEGSQPYFSPSPPALVIISERIARENNFQWVRETRQQFPLLPMIAYTNKENTQELYEALRMGINDFLSSPLSREDVVDCIQANLKKAANLKNYVLLESRRATQQLQARVNELESLIRLGRSITASLDLDEVLRMVVDACVEVTGSEEGSLLLVEEATGDLYMRASRNFNNDFVNTFRLPIQDSLAGTVLRTGEPVVLDEDTPQKIKTSYLVHSLVYVPLKLRQHVIGILGIDNRHTRVSFKQKDVLLLSTMAEYAVIAIENARLYSEIVNEKNKLDAIIGEIEDGVVVIDQEQRLVLINQMARQALGIHHDVAAGQSLLPLLTQQELVDLIQNENIFQSHQLEISDSNEHIYSTQLTAIPSVGMAITLHDITSLKKLDRIKSDFVNTVSHDLRSPLTAILGYVELIERTGQVNELQKEFINRVQTSVHNITTLVEDLLNLGKIEAGFDTRKEATDPDLLLRTTIEQLGSRLRLKNQKISYSSNGVLPQIYINPIQIRQLVDNLISNASKYSPEGTTITVEAYQEQKQIILRVRDEGIGIPQVDIPFIFDKFYRSGNINQEVPGSGLGLAIVKSIVENHQGRIWVESTLGKGSSFTIVLPIGE